MNRHLIFRANDQPSPTTGATSWGEMLDPYALTPATQRLGVLHPRTAALPTALGQLAEVNLTT